MFFFGVFGIQDKQRTVKEFGNVLCPDCERLSRAELIESFTFFHFFFIPLFRWNKKYFITMRCCRSLYTVNEDYFQELKNSDSIDFSRLNRIRVSHDICPLCGNYINPNFNFCPKCGQKL